jgi:hypothetical protein
MNKDKLFMCERCGKEYKRKRYWQKFCSQECQQNDWILKKAEKIKRIKTISCFFFFVFFFSSSAFAIDFEQYADAIHAAENGPSYNLGSEQYGIHSVKYKDEADARRICIRTIKHAYRLWVIDGWEGQETFTNFLSYRYCPKNPKVWAKNVNFYLRKSEGGVLWK